MSVPLWDLRSALKRKEGNDLIVNTVANFAVCAKYHGLAVVNSIGGPRKIGSAGIAVHHEVVDGSRGLIGQSLGGGLITIDHIGNHVHVLEDKGQITASVPCHNAAKEGELICPHGPIGNWWSQPADGH